VDAAVEYMGIIMIIRIRLMFNGFVQNVIMPFIS